jgi:tRNA nucleotidyltransferase/poly(A) polymerase
LLALGYRHKDPAFPVFIHPSTGEEYALARRERKRGQGHKGFVLEYGPDVSLNEDLARRDLTINAMAQDAGGELHDPYGGYEDLARRRLRHVTDAFSEDPLRVLRLARFAAELDDYGFDVAPETALLAAHMSGDGGDLFTLSPGRIWREAERALASTAPPRFFRCLRDCGALPRLMPWLISACDPRCRSTRGSTSASPPCSPAPLTAAALPDCRIPHGHCRAARAPSPRCASITRCRIRTRTPWRTGWKQWTPGGAVSASSRP